LLVAFTFSGALDRFDTRRHLIVEETNAIGTAYLRLDLLSAQPRDALREAFRHYVDSRLAIYRKLPDLEAAREELAHSTRLQGEIWKAAVEASRAESTTPPTMLLLPALNAMIDITTTRTMASHFHPPRVVYVMLFGLALASSLLSGYAMGHVEGRLYVLGFAAAIAVSVYVILDVEFPRLGLIRVDDFDQALVDLRASMD
jgi:hypothetical protein